MSEIKIIIPKVSEDEVVLIPKGLLGFDREIKKRFEKIDNILFGIIASVIVSCIAVVVAVVGLFIDQMRYNNAAYTDYSQKIGSVEITQKINQELLEQNKINQKFILEQQTEMSDLLKKYRN